MPATPLTRELIDALLDKLSSDDQFRADFENDPVGTMKQLGAPPEFAWGECIIVPPLASKDRIQNTREEILRVLLDNLGDSVMNLYA